MIWWESWWEAKYPAWNYHTPSEIHSSKRSTEYIWRKYRIALGYAKRYIRCRYPKGSISLIFLASRASRQTNKLCTTPFTTTTTIKYYESTTRDGTSKALVRQASPMQGTMQPHAAELVVSGEKSVRTDSYYLLHYDDAHF